MRPTSRRTSSSGCAARTSATACPWLKPTEPGSPASGLCSLESRPSERGGRLHAPMIARLCPNLKSLSQSERSSAAPARIKDWYLHLREDEIHLRQKIRFLDLR